MAELDIFNRYYHENFWGDETGSSGPNSAFETTPILRQNLQNLIHTLDIESILDLGCGDANLFKHIDLNGIKYTGIDCVPAMIEDNRRAFDSQENMHFEVGDISRCPLPVTDLVLCRDVVHYLPNDRIQELLQNLNKTGFIWLLMTHNLYSDNSANDTTELGIFRPVNLCHSPFNFPQPQQLVEEDVYGKALALWHQSQVPNGT